MLLNVSNAKSRKPLNRQSEQIESKHRLSEMATEGQALTILILISTNLALTILRLTFAQPWPDPPLCCLCPECAPKACPK